MFAAPCLPGFLSPQMTSKWPQVSLSRVSDTPLLNLQTPTTISFDLSVICHPCSHCAFTTASGEDTETQKKVVTHLMTHVEDW